MIDHILVPLDNSALAECVLPHVLAIAPVMNARVTLLHVMEHPHNGNGIPAVPMCAEGNQIHLIVASEFNDVLCRVAFQNSVLDIQAGVLQAFSDLFQISL